MESNLGALWLDAISSSWWIAMAGGLLFAALQISRRRISLEATWLAWLAAVSIGAVLAVSQANLVDEAFAQLEVARNTASGLGPVFHDGPPTEAIRATGWSVLLGIFSFTGLPLPYLGLSMTLLAWLACAALMLWVGQELWEVERHRTYLPFAAIAFALQSAITPFVLSSLEVLPLAACTLGGLAAILAGRSATAGLLLAASAILRPDHLVFWLAGLLATRSSDRARFALTIGPMALWTLGRWMFFGSLLPQATIASGATSMPMGLGLSRVAAVAAGEHLWVLALLGLISALQPAEERERTLRRFALVGAGMHVLLVMIGGGSEHYAKPLITDMALLLLLAEAALHRGGRWMQLGAAGAMGATLVGLPLLAPRTHALDMTSMHSFYPIKRWAPLEVEHHSQKLGTQLAALSTPEHPLRLATCCSWGAIAWFSHAEVLPTDGSADASLVGADPNAASTVDLLRASGVHMFCRPWSPKEHHRLTAVTFTNIEGLDGRWHLLRWDALVAERAGSETRFIRLTPAVPYLEEWSESIDRRQPREVQQALAFFDAYYFEGNPDPARRALFTDRLNR